MPKISDSKKRANMDEIVSSAKELFILDGYKNVTVDDICKKAKISKGSFYTYFKSKETLFLELAKETEEMKRFLAETPTEKNVETVMLTLWDMIFSDMTTEDIINYRLTLEFWLESFDNNELRQILESKSEKSLTLFKNILTTHLEIVASEEKINTWAIFFWAQAEGLMLYYTAHQKVPTLAEITEIRKLVSNLIDYIKSEAKG